MSDFDNELLTDVAYNLANLLEERGMDIIFIGNWALNQIFEPNPKLLLSSNYAGLDVVVIGLNKRVVIKRIKDVPGRIHYNGSLGSKKLLLEWRLDGFPPVPIDMHFGSSPCFMTDTNMHR